MDGKKPLSGSGWRPLWGDWTVWAGVCCLLSLWKGAVSNPEGSRGRAPLGTLGKGVSSADRAQLMTVVIPSLALSAYSHQRYGEEIAFQVLLLSANFMLS